MALFGNGKSNAKTPILSHAGASLIAEGTVIKGSIIARSEIHIQGSFEGEIQSESAVVIVRNGEGRGTVRAEKMIIGGLFEGESDCNVVEIHSEGKHKGNITTDELVIERGGSFIGNSRLKHE